MRRHFGLTALEAAHAHRVAAGYDVWGDQDALGLRAHFLDALVGEAQAALDAAAAEPIVLHPGVYLVSRAHMFSSKRFDKAPFWLTDYAPGMQPDPIHGPVDLIETESGFFGVDEADIRTLRIAEERARLHVIVPRALVPSTRRMRL